MLPVGWLIAAVLVAVVATMWITFTLTRLDRLHARVDAAQAALDAQLVRRAAALQHVAESPGSRVPPELRGSLERIARDALAAEQDGVARRARENAVGRALIEVAALTTPVDEVSEVELRESAARVLIARRFYNDAVRDTRALRDRRLPRVFHLAGHREMPTFFDIDDTLPGAQHTMRPASPAHGSDPEQARPAAVPTMEEDHS